MQSEIIEVAGILENQDVWWQTLKSSFSFYNLIYFTIIFTIFGWVVAFLLIESREVLFPHFIGITISAIIFAFFQFFIFAYFSFVEWKKYKQPYCTYRISDNGVQLKTTEFQTDITW